MTDTISGTTLTSHPWFFCGIGGSGMLPLALILKGLGAQVSGSDRSHDAGRTPQKFAWLQGLGFQLFPQDGSGITSPGQTLVASAAVEDSVPEVVRARDLGCARMSRAQLLSALFNASQRSIGVAGTSGKSTVTGMIGWILTATGRDPTIMNGAVMKNFVAPDAPFASARVGAGTDFVSEVDESDGSIALYRPTVAVLNNVSLDHKSLEELRALFGDFLKRATTSVVNFDDAESAALAQSALASGAALISFGLTNPTADIGVLPGSIIEGAAHISARIIERRTATTQPLSLKVPGRHNLANALAAIGAARALGVPMADAIAALQDFAGLARRFDIIGHSPSGAMVIDDFGHNPDKVAATLRTLKAQGQPVIAFFQPHGYGPLRQMGTELAATFAQLLGPQDTVILCDPVYFGGTVDRAQGSERIVALIAAEPNAPAARHIASRADCAPAIAAIAASLAAASLAAPNIVIMGARDDSLSAFAQEVLAQLT